MASAFRFTVLVAAAFGLAACDGQGSIADEAAALEEARPAAGTGGADAMAAQASADEAAETPLFEKSAEAIALLEQAGAAIRQIDTARFKTRYRGLLTGRGAYEGEIAIRRLEGQDPDLGFMQHLFRGDIAFDDVLYANEMYPREFSLYVSPDEAVVVNAQTREAETAAGAARVPLSTVLYSAVLPQYLLAEPFAMEISDSIGARIIGEETVGGVLCDVVWLKFSDESGYGEQRLYFGKSDRLIRKATLAIPKSSAGPANFIEIEHTELSVNDDLPGDFFEAQIPDDYDVSTYRIDKYVAGVPAPSWELARLGGGTFGSDDLAGEVGVLVFWASWCPVCHAYFPELQKMYAEYEGRGVNIIAINAMDNDDYAGFLKRHEYDFDVAVEGEALAKKFGVVGFPAVAVIDREGIIRYWQPRVGTRTERYREIRNVIDETLAMQG